MLGIVDLPLLRAGNLEEPVGWHGAVDGCVHTVSECHEGKLTITQQLR